ncbi:hypothetical protein C3Y05_003780 [Aeromonas allosaccharophila]|uniref:hypothetical protein n=1 Tax=Aeromonas allosaccharophila TaxID=656 RepID=UPI0013CC5785|nr:hypothetical protein [Aeromonas allosaccharophila]WDO02756.1 hypothetical protein C3Y05_003780 [Aeromonas allosaccharophila]
MPKPLSGGAGLPGTLHEQGLAVFMADACAMLNPMFGQLGEGLLQEAVAALIAGSDCHASYFAAQPFNWQQAQLVDAASLPKQPSQSERPDWPPERLSTLNAPI